MGEHGVGNGAGQLFRDARAGILHAGQHVAVREEGGVGLDPLAIDQQLAGTALDERDLGYKRIAVLRGACAVAAVVVERLQVGPDQFAEQLDRGIIHRGDFEGALALEFTQHILGDGGIDLGNRGVFEDRHRDRA